MSLMRKSAAASRRVEERPEETWTDSAFWGAGLVIFLLILLLLGAGYFGYVSLERPQGQSERPAARSSAPATATPRAAAPRPRSASRAPRRADRS